MNTETGELYTIPETIAAAQAHVSRRRRARGFWIEVDGEPMHVLGDPDMPEATLNALRELARAARKAIEDGTLSGPSDEDKPKERTPMEITEVSVSYGLTQSLPEYSNVKPSVTLRATISDEEDPADIKRYLFEMARQWVEAEVDAALEANGRPARYSQERRYQVIATRQHMGYGDRRPPLENVVAIIPSSMPLPGDSDWHHAQSSYASEGIRYQHALKVAGAERNRRDATRIIVCHSTEDLVNLPQRPPEKTEEAADDAVALAREARDYGDYPDEDEEF